ncbi:MAG: SH3 domain-containing protein [Bryobacteraceae bacterium]
MLAACQPGAERAPALGYAYVAPEVLKIRKEISTQSPTVGTVRHGQRLELLQQRRRFLKVRTPSGAEGWTDETQLLSEGDMEMLRDLARRSSQLPSQGKASVLADLRMHIQPARPSTGFAMIKPGEKVDVLAHTATPRNFVPPRRPLLEPVPKKPRTPAPKKASKYPPLPMPKPPGPPENWLDLSGVDSEGGDTLPQPAPPAEPSKPAPAEDWSLVKAAGGEVGWVLTRPLQMTIPDEVQQYAEGRRIVSFFSLGKVRDGDLTKDIWVWTTISDSSPRSIDFDSFRVFIWNVRHHRYETAHVEHDIEGHSPVLVHEIHYIPGVRNSGNAGAYPGFSVCALWPEGTLERHDYALLGNVVRRAGVEPCTVPPPVFSWQTSQQSAANRPAPPPPPPPPSTPSLAQRILRRVSRWFGK